MHISMEEALLWIMDSCFGQKWYFRQEVENILVVDLFL